MQTVPDQRYLIIVFGCPGSGKTHLASALFRQFLAEKEYSRKPLLLSVDILENYLTHHSIQDLDILLSKLLSSFSESGLNLNQKIHMTPAISFDPELWKLSRNYLRQKLQTLILQNPKINTFIIQDDFLLNSMRKPIRNLAARKQLHYAEVYLETTIQQCIVNDEARGCKVGAKLIRDKYGKLQKNPEAVAVQWGFKEQQISKILKHILYRMLVPVLPIEQSKKQVVTKISEKELTQIKIRKIVAEIMKNTKTLEQFFGMPGVDRGIAGKIISKAKESYKLQNGVEGFCQHLKIFLQKHRISK